MSAIEFFFRDLDALWKWPAEEKTSLRIIGSTALMLQADYERGTKDSDVLQTSDLSSETKQRLLNLAGRDTEIHKRRRLYIDVVSGGLPFLPQRPDWTHLSLELEHFELSVLSVVDVVVSKLKRFNGNDISDIEEMIARDLVPHDMLIERFNLAVNMAAYDARAEDLSKYVENLHQVERDMLTVPESNIELPSWV